nr:MAG TPA: hypothetical protein [Caudoviricetes sp.]
MIQYACLGHCIFGSVFAALVLQHQGGFSLYILIVPNRI